VGIGGAVQPCFPLAHSLAEYSGRLPHVYPSGAIFVKICRLSCLVREFQRDPCVFVDIQHISQEFRKEKAMDLHISEK